MTDPAEIARATEAYFARFTPCDVAARCSSSGGSSSGGRSGGSSAATCHRDYVASVLVPTSSARAAVTAAATQAHRALATLLRSDAAAPSASLAALHAEMGWRVALLDDRAEAGWPHTHADVVCIPTKLLHDDALTRTLVHERVHVLQRARPDLAAAYCRAARYPAAGSSVPVAAFPPGSAVATRRRSNPDLDGRLYGRTDFVVASLFPSEAAAAEGGLRAARVAWVDAATGEIAPWAHPLPPQEHPWEAMAYDIAARVALAT